MGSSPAPDFFVRFWGVRGSIAVGSPEVVRYGGNTSCLEIRCGNRLLIFDGGTGVRGLGNRLRPEMPVSGDIFLSHTHYDHVCGLPHFCPFFDPRSQFRVHAGHVTDTYGIRGVLKMMMTSPLFPVPLEIFQAQMTYRDFHQGEDLDLGDGIVVKTVALSHPDKATGFRVEFNGKSICYITDTEHPADGCAPALVEFLRGADIVIYDSMYTPEEYPMRRGWGHSTWAAGVALCEAAGATTFVVFHHDPDHDDIIMDALAQEVAVARPGTIVAREGLVMRP